MTSDRPANAYRIDAPAKINLYLHVLGRRADGYHRIDSLIAFAAAHDTLTVRSAKGLSLFADGPFAAGLPPAKENLVMRAAEALADAHAVTAGAAITLTKYLPLAAGIGGGSADAAASLLALDKLWGIGAAPAELARIGLRLGADVPACLLGGPLYAGGIGEDLEPAKLPSSLDILLVNPGVQLATAAVFGAFNGHFSGSGRLAAPVEDARGLADELAMRRNDLTDAAMTVAPAVRAVLDALESQDGCLLARLSGSGPTCFGIFESKAAATAAGKAIAAVNGGWWVCPSRLRELPATPQPAD